MKQLIVNADDYGCTASVSAGIRQAHLRGIVTTVTDCVGFALFLGLATVLLPYLT